MCKEIHSKSHPLPFLFHLVQETKYPACLVRSQYFRAPVGLRAVWFEGVNLLVCSRGGQQDEQADSRPWCYGEAGTRKN